MCVHNFSGCVHDDAQQFFKVERGIDLGINTQDFFKALDVGL